jgi:DNA-binding NarL/FixJ family response regulator
MPIHPQVARQLVRSLAKRGDMNGNKPLTERERQVLQLMSQGLSNKAVAQALNLSEGTVKVHVSSILGKLHASSRTEASIKALQAGLVSPINDI